MSNKQLEDNAAVQCPFHTRQKKILDPIPMRWKLLAILYLGRKERSKSFPIRMLAAFQILVAFSDRVLETLDAIEHGFLV